MAQGSQTMTSRKGLQLAGSVLPAFGFLAMGLVAGFALIATYSFLDKRAGSLTPILIVGGLIVVPLLAAFHWRSFGQLWEGARVTFKNLYWYHWLWALIFLSWLTWRKRDLSETKSEPVDTYAAVQLVLVTLVGSILLYRLFLRKPDFLKSWFRGIPLVLMLFVLWTLTSTLWSIYWQWTLFKACEYAVDVALLGAVLAVVKDPVEWKRLYDWNWMWYSILLGMCWFGAAVWPDTALNHQLEYGESGIGIIPVQLSGVFPDLSANRVGEYSAVIALVAIVRLLPVPGYKRKAKSWYAWLLLASLITMTFAQTRSAILGFGIGLILVYAFSGRFWKGVAIVVGGGFVLLITGIGTVLFEYMRRGQSLQEMETLTGRVQWWIMAYKQYMNSPFTGYGAWAASRFLIMGSIGNNIASMHSDWVETMIGCGFIGVGPLVAVLWMGWSNLMKFVRDFSLSPLERQLALEAMAVFAVGTARMFFSSDLTWHAPLTFWIPLGFAEFLRRQYVASRAPQRVPAYAVQAG